MDAANCRKVIATGLQRQATGLRIQANGIRLLAQGMPVCNQRRCEMDRVEVMERQATELMQQAVDVIADCHTDGGSVNG